MKSSLVNSHVYHYLPSISPSSSLGLSTVMLPLVKRAMCTDVKTGTNTDKNSLGGRIDPVLGFVRQSVPRARYDGLIQYSISEKKLGLLSPSRGLLYLSRTVKLLKESGNGEEIGKADLSSSVSGPYDSTSPPVLERAGTVTVSSDSHPDFMPRVVTSSPSIEEAIGGGGEGGDRFVVSTALKGNAEKDEATVIKEDIKDTVASEEVVLFMKGVPDAPVCGFSKLLVDTLESLGLEYTSFDCLAHPVVRTYVKELSRWPTIPQLFIKNEFVGGVDIVLEMASNGELTKLLDKHNIKYRKDEKDEKASGSSKGDGSEANNKDTKDNTREEKKSTSL